MMKILHIQRGTLSQEVDKLIEIVSRDRENQSFNLDVETPDYEQLVEMIWEADQTICWW